MEPARRSNHPSGAVKPGNPESKYSVPGRASPPTLNITGRDQLRSIIQSSLSILLFSLPILTFPTPIALLLHLHGG
jgi:hypothetical protein